MSIAKRTKDKKKQWRAVVSVYDSYGKRHQKTSKWFDRKADAVQAELDLKARAADTTVGRTFGSVCREWIESTRAEVTKKTFNDKTQMMTKYLASILDMRLDEITPAVIKVLFQDEDFLALCTIRRNRVRGIVAGTFRYAMSMYGFPNNPVDAFPAFKKTDEERLRGRTVYTPDQFQQVIQEVDSDHGEHKDALVFLFRTGMRLNEALSLTFADIMPQDKSVHTWRQYVDDEWVTLKTPHSDRVVSLDSSCRDVIDRQRRIYEYLPGFSPDWFLFGGPEPMPTNTLRSIFYSAQEAAGLSHSRLHDLRHAHASVLIANMKGDGDILKISRRLGHSSVSTTVNIYAHLLHRDEDDIIDVLDSI